MKNPVLQTLRECGLWRLAYKDGCECLNFAIHGVHVDVSCRKSGGNTHPDGGTTIRVYSHSEDWRDHEDMLREIGEEVAGQLAECGGYDRHEHYNVLLEEYETHC